MKIAKDGTNRGGRRVRAGDKPMPLADKIIKGQPADVLDIPELSSETLYPHELDDVCDLSGEKVPAPSDYLSAKQRDGTTLGADLIYKETFKWLKERGCHKFVSPRLVESFSQSFARYIQCEKALSTYGLLGKHPTTGAAISSPFVQMSLSFQKQSNLLWYEIFDIVKQNCTTAFDSNPQDDIMEALLSGKM